MSITIADFSSNLIYMPKPGSPKGQSKPLKRQLDARFQARLRTAMKAAQHISVPDLARKVGCTRAALHNYLKEEKSSIEAFLLFKLADALGVSARWLLLEQGSMRRAETLTREQLHALDTLGKLRDPALRDYWLSAGEELERRQPVLHDTNSQHRKLRSV